jgi:hypothetical protein
VCRLTGQFVTYPLDIVRRRMQMRVVTAAASAGTLASLRTLYRGEGVRGLFKGYSLNVFKGPVTLSLSLTTYDFLQSLVPAADRDPPSAPAAAG